ncbi:permease [Anaerosolibacter sp.]|uniref:permease n=1 Tax=Anaerosolibacter sp. TaxID=1872527 RepID=UPI0039EF2595
MLETEKKTENFFAQLGMLAFLGFILFIGVYITWEGFKLPGDSSVLEGFTTVFLSIILEAIPFVMIGAFVSSVIQIFVSEQTIARIIPKNRFLGLLAASLMGFIFPVCECAIVPIMRRLMNKGVPLYIAVTFMLAVPIANPVVLASTYYAFSGQISMVFLRGGLGILGAILIGHMMGLLEGRNNPLKSHTATVHSGCGCGHDHSHDHHHDVPQLIQIDLHGGCGCGQQHNHAKKHSGIKLRTKLMEVAEHTSLELYDVGKFLIMGAFLAALMQTFVSRSYILSIGQGSTTSVLVMMLMAFILSLCSEADAFIARTFLGQFTTGSIVGFLIFGPMIDIKNTLMLSGAFRGKFVAKLITVIFGVCFMLAMLVNIIG